MASPPFVISNAIPADNDVVSQFPGVDRTLRDIVTSWLSIDHNTNPGGHTKLTMDQIADPSPVSGKTLVSARTDGSVVKQVGVAAAEYIGAFPGAIVYGAVSSAPQGWLATDGSAVSRSTYATLFAAIGVTFGIGDGSTTFNLPNLQDRVVRTKGSTYVLGASGGGESVTLAAANVPDHTHGSSVADTHTHPTNVFQTGARGPGPGDAVGQVNGGFGQAQTAVANVGAIAVTVTSHGGTAPTGGVTPTPASIINSYITLTAFIKY